MGGKTSAKSKNTHANSVYDRFPIIVPKGLKDYYVKEAKAAGFSSLSSYVRFCMDNEIAERRGIIRTADHLKAEFAYALLGNQTEKTLHEIGTGNALLESLQDCFKGSNLIHLEDREIKGLAADSIGTVIAIDRIKTWKDPEATLRTLMEALHQGSSLLLLYDGKKIDKGLPREEGMMQGASVVSYHPDSVVATIKKNILGADQIDAWDVTSGKHKYEDWYYILVKKKEQESAILLDLEKPNDSFKTRLLAYYKALGK